MPTLSVYITEREYLALTVAARKQRRQPDQQAAVIIVDALAIEPDAAHLMTCQTCGWYTQTYRNDGWYCNNSAGPVYRQDVPETWGCMLHNQPQEKEE